MTKDVMEDMMLNTDGQVIITRHGGVASKPKSGRANER